jgi:hypothetical protein
MALVLEIAAGICLGIFACVALWLLTARIIYWHTEQRWRRAFKKHERMVESLSRRYSRHLLEEAGLKLPWRADALKSFMPIDGGEEQFDPAEMAKIKEFGQRVDAMR